MAHNHAVKVLFLFYKPVHVQNILQENQYQYRREKMIISMQSILILCSE